MGLLYSSRRALLGGQKGLPPLDFDPALLTFTAGMDKRAGKKMYDRVPIIQGLMTGLGVPDVMGYGRGDLLGNATGLFYSNLDPYQFDIALVWTPEYTQNVGTGTHYLWYASANYHAEYDYDNDRYSFTFGGQTMTVTTNIAAGTSEFLTFGGNCHKTFDGTNYCRVTRNDAGTFGCTTKPTASIPGATIYVGSNGATGSGSGIFEGFTVFRRNLWDGAYGESLGNGDEINLFYAAAAGRDITEIVGSWDGFCLPTNQADEALQTTGEAWSHPHGSNILDARSTGEENCFACDGGYLAEPYSVLFNGTTTYISCGSDADIDDIADAEMTIEAWIRADSWGENNNGYILCKNGVAFNVGWSFEIASTVGLVGVVRCATTNAVSYSGLDEFTVDGKWHHVVMYFNDAGDRKVYLAIDGRWVASYSTQTAGVGAIVSDAAATLLIGNRSGAATTFDGAIGWCAISNNDRHTVGTDFIAPRTFPADDANYLASWAMNEGTGATVANTGNQGGGGSGAANRNGTIANGTWISTWEFEGTPPVLPVLEYDGSTTSTVITDFAAAQDLADNAFTVEAWVRADGWGELTSGIIIEKQGVTRGWVLTITSGAGALRGIIRCATTDADSRASLAQFSPDKQWHHIAMQFDDAGDRKIYLWIDGIPITYSTQTAGVGLIQSDVGDDIEIGNRGTAQTWDGAFGGWSRISDILRYTNGKAFVPADMANPPAPDGNTVWQTDYSDGAGTTLTDDSGGANNGTITFGTGRWYNWVDCETIAPGHRIYQWGYMLASDAADDGVTVYSATGLAAGSNYVARVPVKYGYSRRGQPSIQAYDETNGAAITTFDGPPLVGTHLVGAASATLVVTGAVFPYSLVGGVVYNITDQSVGTITAVGGTNQDTITAALAGGGSNDWNVGEQYMIVPPNESSWTWCEHFCFELPTIARNGVAADCTAFSIKLMNASGEGVLFWQQAEVQTCILDNPSLETGAGNPWIPDGWTNNGMDPGDTLAASAGLGNIHSGSEALQYAVGADTAEYIYGDGGGGAVGGFFCWGLWYYGVDAYSCRLRLVRANRQTVLNGSDFDRTTIANWFPYFQVYRRLSTGAQSPGLRVAAVTAAKTWDDVYFIDLDPITLTVTPTSEANSAESGGLRIDGRDVVTQPIPAGAVAASEGWIRWNSRLRHASADLDKFGATDPVLVEVWGDANNNASAYVQAANTIRLSVTSLGVTTTADWACAGDIVADTSYLFEFRWSGSALQLYQDGVLQQQVVAAIAFGTVPTTIYWGCDQAGDGNIDAVYIAP